MSLNGLDDVKVKEAHDGAIAEPGGWFLLKYISRDEVELFGRGNGGIVEIRNAIAKFDEDSPLFGFLRYRRRSVIIKYVPESCSRLVQARVHVHFNAVTERFTPHDTVFPLTSSKELRDTTLSNACSLHTASGSISSSTSSLRRRRLMEIAEDADEDKRASVVVEEHPPTAKAPSMSGSQESKPLTVPTVTSPGQESTITFRSTVTDTDSVSPSLSPPQLLENRPRSPTQPVDERRKSSQSTRPEPYSYNSYTSSGKPKVKLGPRPSLDITGRPHTSGSNSFRPVSTLPAGLKLFSRSPKKSKERPQSQNPDNAPTMTLSPPPMPGSDIAQQTNMLVRPHTSGGRPTSSSGVSMRPPLSPPSITLPKQPAMTPEKARLMKALQMRKKKMNAQPQEDVSPLPLRTEHTLNPEAAEADHDSPGAPKTVPETLDMLSDMAKADSAIAIEASSVETIGSSQTTRTSSTPASPVENSEADSTQASSISESTDETARESGLKEENIHNENSAQLEELSAIQKAHDKLTGASEPNFEKGKNGGDNEIPSLNVTVIVPKTLEASNVTIKAPQHINPAEEKMVENEQETRKETDQEQSPENLSETKETIEDDVPLAVVDIPSPLEDIFDSKEIMEDDLPPPAEMLLPRSTFNGDFSESKPSPGRMEIASSKEQIVSVDDHLQKTSFDDERKVTMQDLLDAGDAVKAPEREWKIPRSKFSVQDLKASDIAPSSTAQKSPVSSTFSNDSKRSFTDDDLEEGASDQKRKKRRGLVDPIRTDLATSAENSESELDDDLMDELQDAQVQEAKPIMVSKSPITPVFPSQIKRTPTESSRFARTFSNPFSKDGTKPQEPREKVNIPPRSVSASAAYLNRINQQQTVPVVKKVNLGSGISQRIKALEKLSSAVPAASGTPIAPPLPSPSFFSVRKAGGRRSPSVAERTESLTRNTPSPSISRESSPETLKLRDRSGSVQSRTQAFNSPPQSILPKSRPESISVTARIVRDPNQPLQLKPEILHKDPLDYTPLDLKQSPLVIDHQKAVVVPQAPKETIQARRLSKEQPKEPPQGLKERRSSITVIKDFISDGRNSLSERRTSFSGSRKSMTIEAPVLSPSVLSPSRPPSTHTNSPSYHGRPVSVSSKRSNSSRDLSGLQSPFTAGPTLSTSPTPNDDESKKAGRASRMLRRMSSSISASRKTLAHAISPTVREESEPPQTGKQSLTPSQFSQSSVGATVSVEIGDVNVQFPDTLLWKRRSMQLDSHGYLLLSQAQGNKGMERSATNKRYHLGEFRTPFIPEMEVQELPNSVVLDFVEGSGLQIACEDRGGQAKVLQVLQEGHRAWAAYGQ